MSRSFSKTIFSVGIVLALTVTLFAQISEKPATASSGKPSGTKSDSQTKPIAFSDQAVKFRGLFLGETNSDKDRPGYYERVLLPGPEEANVTLRGLWEIPLDWAIELGKMDIEKRRSVIRRNLELPPEANDDLILWKEVIDALLEQIGRLSERKTHDYGLRVEFPGQADDAKAKVDLTFNSTRMKDDDKNNFESELSQIIGGLWTGVEGFVKIEDDRPKVPSTTPNNDDKGPKIQNATNSSGNSPSSSAALKYLTSNEMDEAMRSIRIQLINSDGDEVKGIAVNLQGNYYRISSIPGNEAVDAKFGTDYWLRIIPAVDRTAEKETPGKLVKDIYVPIRQGMRTRVDVTLKRSYIFPPSGIPTFGKDAATIPGAPVAVNTAYLNFLTSNPILGVLTQVLPANPGLHIGVLQIKDAGPQVLWSSRFRLIADTKDRGPQFVDQGTLKLQLLTETNDPEKVGKPSIHYVKITWRGRADEDQLAFKSRHNAKFLGINRDFLGIGLGVVPSLTPSLFAVGASLKFIKGCEIFLGAGIRKGYSTSFAYGLTLDVADMLSAVGITAASGGQSAAPSTGSAAQAGQTGKTPPPSPIQKID